MSKIAPAVAEAPGVMRTTGWSDYALLDSGDGRKLERYGPYSVVRPEPPALWSPQLAPPGRAPRNRQLPASSSSVGSKTASASSQALAGNRGVHMHWGSGRTTL